MTLAEESHDWATCNTEGCAGLPCLLGSAFPAWELCRTALPELPSRSGCPPVSHEAAPRAVADGRVPLLGARRSRDRAGGTPDLLSRPLRLWLVCIRNVHVPLIATCHFPPAPSTLAATRGRAHPAPVWFPSPISQVFPGSTALAPRGDKDSQRAGSSFAQTGPLSLTLLIIFKSL